MNAIFSDLAIAPNVSWIGQVWGRGTFQLRCTHDCDFLEDIGGFGYFSFGLFDHSELLGQSGSLDFDEDLDGLNDECL